MQHSALQTYFIKATEPFPGRRIPGRRTAARSHRCACSLRECTALHFPPAEFTHGVQEFMGLALGTPALYKLRTKHTEARSQGFSPGLNGSRAWRQTGLTGWARARVVSDLMPPPNFTVQATLSPLSLVLFPSFPFQRILNFETINVRLTAIRKSLQNNLRFSLSVRSTVCLPCYLFSSSVADVDVDM